MTAVALLYLLLGPLSDGAGLLGSDLWWSPPPTRRPFLQGDGESSRPQSCHSQLVPLVSFFPRGAGTVMETTLGLVVSCAEGGGGKGSEALGVTVEPLEAGRQPQRWGVRRLGWAGRSPGGLLSVQA